MRGSHFISQECKQKRHADCDGYVPRKEFYDHDHSCDYAPGDDTLNIDGMLEYQIECIGSDTVTFTDLMTTILQNEQAQTDVSDDTITENLEEADESLDLADTVTASAGTRPYKYGPTSPQARYGFGIYS